MNAQQIAKQLVDDYNHEALEIALDVVRSVTAEIAARRASAIKADAVGVRRRFTSDESAARIRDAVCEFFDIAQHDLMAETRRYARARSIAMFLMRTRLAWTFMQIGEYFGRDHTSCITACRRVGDDPAVTSLIAQLDACKKLPTLAVVR